MPSNSSYNEKELLRQIAQGEGEAFSSLYAHYHPIIYKVAFRLTGEHEIAKDILQDTFTSVWLNRADLPQLENFSGWLYTVARNLTMNALSGIARRALHSRQHMTMISPLPIDTGRYKIEEKELEHIVRKVIVELPEQQLKVYQLIKEQGLSRNEAATTLGVGTETIKTHLERAMRYIRARLIKELELKHLIIILIFLFKYLVILSPRLILYLS